MKQKRSTGAYAVCATILLAAVLCLAARQLGKRIAPPFASPIHSIAAPNFPAQNAVAPIFPIQINPATCADSNLRSDLEAVARDVAAVVPQRFAAAPPEFYPVVLSRGSHPHVYPPHKGVFRIELAFNFQHRDYARLTYEFAHEMGHMMLGTRGYPCGVDEVLATAASLQALDDMDARWAVQPPYSSWQDFHAYFCQYRAFMEEQSLAALPVQIQQAVRQRRWDAVTLYLRYHIPDMEADIRSDNSRNLQTLAAILIRSTTLPWPEFAGASTHISYHSAAEAKTARGMPSDLRQAHLTLWRIGREHANPLSVAHFIARPRFADALLQQGFLFQEVGEWVWLMESDKGSIQRLWNQVALYKPSRIELFPAN